MDDDKATQTAGEITLRWDGEGSLHFSITGGVGALHLFGAAHLLRLEGEKMYLSASIQEAQSKGPSLIEARSLPLKQ